MFTGIVETVGKVIEVIPDKSNRHFKIESSISHELRVDQSISHDGVCLTVTKVQGSTHWVTAVDETLKKSNLGKWSAKQIINLERCMKADGRFDGHIVQGHVDQVATCKKITNREGSFLIQFDFELTESSLLVEKGSICVNGTSLTCFNVTSRSFEVAIIPYTWDNTNFHTLQAGDSVNLEFDIVGKYIKALIEKR